MNTYVIIHFSTLSVNTYYNAVAPNYSMFGGENGNPQASIHLPVPEGLTWDTVKGVRDPETGEVTLQIDPDKVEEKNAQAWSDLRYKRNQLLTASDWTQLPDTRVSKDTWAEYRQKLRDLPDGLTDPIQVTWPVPPM
jgi:hypothetical protein